MPTTSAKPLYLAKSMKELDASVSTKADFKTKSTLQLISSANTLFQAAEKSTIERDEERAYTFFMRFIDLMLILKKREEFKKNQNYKTLIQQTNPAIIKAEDLKSSLLKRYPSVQKKLESSLKAKNDKNDLISAMHNKTDPTAAGDIHNNVEISKITVPAETSISCSRLFSLLTTNDSNIILMDVRPAEDFEESHVKHSRCIAVSEEILSPGITAAKLETLLPAESLDIWNSRGEADSVILIDWGTVDDSNPSMHLRTLKQAMCKWDQKCTLKKPPMILLGGYKDWMLKYPMYTTQALNLFNKDSSTSPIVADISSVEYPSLDDNTEKNTSSKEIINGPGPLFKKTSAPLPVINNASDSVDSRKTKSAPSFDRKSKPVNDLKPSTATAHQLNKNNIAQNGVSEHKLLPTSHHSLYRNADQVHKLSKDNLEKDEQIYSLMKEESLAKDSLELVKEQLMKEQEFEKLCLRKEKEAEESRRMELQKQEDLLIERLKQVDLKLSEKELELRKTKEDNARMKKKLNEFKDKELQVKKEIEINAAEKERQSLQEQVKRMREERKIKEDKMKLESKPDATPRGIVSANSGLKRHGINQDQNSQNSEYTVPLSRQSSTDNSSRGLVRSHSSPNIAQMINSEESNLRKMPAFDRNLKPSTPSYQSFEVSRARLRNLNPVYGNCSATGLRNLGNTCFMNSVIQCLANTLPLVDYFISNKYLEDLNRDNKQGMAGEVAEEFAIVLRSLWFGQYKSFSPKDFKNTVSKCLSVCIGNEQQDSHEFLVVLMEKLHADLNRKTVRVIPKIDSCADENQFWQHHKSYNSSKISELFEGLLKSTLTCMTCHKTSDSYEVFSCLSLPISASRCSLRDCFQHFLKSEKISGEAAWDCPRCKQKKEAEKRLRICRLPEVLAIQLKRFSYEGLWRRKLQTHVDFDFSFDVPYQRNSEEIFRNYSLYGIVNHYGTLEGGHYIAVCNATSNKWYKYDDHEVSEISLSDIRTSAAYLLFYRANDLRSNL